jgi:hypothetical protein
VKISAVQAAQLVGRNERRIRDWIATQRLPAMKVGQTWQIDVDDLERLPGVTIDREQLELLQGQEAGTPPGLHNRVHDLEQIVQLLQNEVELLKTQIREFESQQVRGASTVLEFSHSEHTPVDLHKYAVVTPLPPHREIFSDGAVDLEVEPPAGSIRVKQFALIHKVHAAILTYQIETGKIEDTALSMANGRKAHWLTPEQQQEVVTFWRLNGTHFVPCPACPHRYPVL